MALTKEVPLPIRGGFTAPSAYLHIGKITVDRAKREVSFSVEVYRDRESRLANGAAWAALAMAEARIKAALAALAQADAMEVSEPVSQLAQATAHRSAAEEVGAARIALEAAHAAVSDEANHPFREYMFPVPLADVSDDGETPDVGKLYRFAKAAQADLADAQDC